MKILFLAHRIPYPPDKGDKIRAFAELRALAARGHEIHLFAFADDLNDLQYQVDLSRHCAKVRVLPLRGARGALRAAVSLPAGRPLSVAYYSSLRMKRLINRSVRETDFDAVVVYSSTMFQYVPAGLAGKTVVDLVDVDSRKWLDYSERTAGLKSRLYRIESARLRRYELEIVRRAAGAILSSDREAKLLDELDEFTRRARLRVMTNGVDSEYFQPAHAVSGGRPVLAFTGTMDYLPNVDGVCWFVEQVWPLIRARSRDAEFMIVGRNPVRSVRMLARQPGVSVTGGVDDIRPYLIRATAVVAPLNFASGVQNKVLEAMASGKPIIATPAAVAGLRVEDGRQVSIAETPGEFAEAVVAILDDASRRESLSREARRFVEREHQWDDVLATLVSLVESFGRPASGAKRAASGRSST